MTTNEIFNYIQKQYNIIVVHRDINSFEFELSTDQIEITETNLKKYKNLTNLINASYADSLNIWGVMQVCSLKDIKVSYHGNTVQFKGCDTVLLSFIKYFLRKGEK